MTKEYFDNHDVISIMEKLELQPEAPVKNLLDMYQDFTKTTWVENYNPLEDFNHAAFGLLAEAGEVAAAYQKFFRGDYGEQELTDRVSKELGGLMYYIAMLCNIEGLRLSEIVLKNRDILIDRQNRGVIKGDGDNR